MKYYFFISFFIFSYCTFSQDFFQTPPGTIKVNNSLYIDKAPIDNLMYLEFIMSVEYLWNYTLNDSLKSLKLKDINKSLLSSSLNPNENKRIYDEINFVEDIKISSKVHINDYFNHPHYYNHPVVGIKKNLAQLYCIWRTDMVNMLWSQKIKGFKKQYKKIKYRLPTIKEYETARKTFQTNKKLFIFDKSSPLDLNFKSIRNKDVFALYNASEFTSSKNYLTQNLSNKNKEKYTFFRCVCELDN